MQVLLALQRDFVALTRANTEAQIVAQLLRGACDPLGFRRAIYFTVEREHGIEARAQICMGGDVQGSSVVPNRKSDSPFFEALRGADDWHGAESQSALPLDDARGPCVLIPLRDGTNVVGVLYARADDDRVREADASLVAALAAVAAAAIVNCARLACVTDLAMIEPLTGLRNRRALAERLLLELELCRSKSSSLTYATIDVDDLKAINDSCGHAQGDATLKAVADVLDRSSRAGDVVGRMSGDEFVVILPGADGEFARELVARLSHALRRAGLRCSLGAAVFPHDADGAAALMLCADRALYATKAAGKDGYSFA